MRRLVHRVKFDIFDFALGPARIVGYSARLAFRRRSSVVERILGKAEVGSSILPGGTTSPSVGAPGLIALEGVQTEDVVDFPDGLRFSDLL